MATAVWSLGEILALPVAAALVSDLSPAELRGRYQGVFAASLGVGMFVAPALGTAVMHRMGAQALWAGCFIVGLVVAAGHLAIAGPRRRRLAARRFREQAVSLA